MTHLTAFNRLPDFRALARAVASALADTGAPPAPATPRRTTGIRR